MAIVTNHIDKILQAASLRYVIKGSHPANATDWDDIPDPNNTKPDDNATNSHVFYQSAAPTVVADDLQNGDVWFDIDDNNHLYIWNGAHWVSHRDPSADWNSVSGWGKPENYATNGATFGSNIDGKITSSNIENYFGQSVISDAYIGNLSAGKISGGEINVNSSNGAGGTIEMGGLLIGYDYLMKLYRNAGSTGGAFRSVSYQESTYANFFASYNMSECAKFFSNSSSGSYIVQIDGEFGNRYALLDMRGHAYGSSLQSINRNSGANAGRFVNTGSGTIATIATPAYAFDAGSSGYGPFTGAHDVLLGLNHTFEIGDIAVDDYCIHKKSISETLFKVKKSSRKNEKGVIGIIAKIIGMLDGHEPSSLLEAPKEELLLKDGQKQYDYETNNIKKDFRVKKNDKYHALKNKYMYAITNALGEGQINVCGENGDLEAGDLIVASSRPGKGMKQSDDIVRSYTVAKAREVVRFKNKRDLKQIPCIYLCG